VTEQREGLDIQCIGKSNDVVREQRHGDPIRRKGTRASMAAMVPEDEMPDLAEPVQASIRPVVETRAAVRHQTGGTAPRLLEVERYSAYVDLWHRITTQLSLPKRPLVTLTDSGTRQVSKPTNIVALLPAWTSRTANF
jgi:hypothetical protein